MLPRLHGAPFPLYWAASQVGPWGLGFMVSRPPGAPSPLYWAASHVLGLGAGAMILRLHWGTSRCTGQQVKLPVSVGWEYGSPPPLGRITAVLGSKSSWCVVAGVMASWPYWGPIPGCTGQQVKLGPGGWGLWSPGPAGAHSRCTGQQVKLEDCGCGCDLSSCIPSTKERPRQTSLHRNHHKSPPQKPPPTPKPSGSRMPQRRAGSIVI